MKSYHKIAVIGGTGKAGKYLVKNLLAQGFELKLLLRNPENLTVKSSQIEIIKGDARNIEAISELLKGCDAVISTIGQPKGEESIFSDATKNILVAMENHQISRYIVITGLNVDTPFDQKNETVKAGTEWMKANYPKTTADKQIEYELLVNSKIDWTLVRLPMIELTDHVSEVKVDLKDCPSDHISASNLAVFLVQQISDLTYIKKAPFIGNV